jgi:Putative zinc-finger
VTCPEERLVAFLAGDLSTGQERDFDQHLLECESCWREVQADQLGRLAIERLREPAPAGLNDRVSLAISLERPLGALHRTRLRQTHPRRARYLSTAILLVIAAAGTVVGLIAVSGSTDPPQVSAVVAMVTPGAQPTSALLTGERLVINHQQMTVRAYMIHGKEAIVATSMKPLPMPASSHLLAGSSRRAWMATTGNLALYGINRPVGQASMFVAAAMPMAALPQVATQLHLI